MLTVFQRKYESFYSSLKNFVKRISILWAFLRWSKNQFNILSRLKDVLMMMILFHIWPEQTYRFSTRRWLPSKANRFSKDSKPVIPFDLLKSKSSNISFVKEINLISHGTSFDLKNIKKLNGPIFLSFFWDSLKIDSSGTIIYPIKHYPWDPKATGLIKVFEKLNDQQKKTLQELKNSNLTYIHSVRRVVELIKKNGHNALAVETYAIDKEGNYILLGEKCEAPLKISIVEKIYQHPPLTTHTRGAPIGNFLSTLCALSYFAEKINVYGWDYYLKSPPEKMGYWRLFFNMYKYELDISRSRNHFESALINFYYGYQLSKLPNFNIHGYMGQLDKHKKMIKRIERVLFNAA